MFALFRLCLIAILATVCVFASPQAGMAPFSWNAGGNGGPGTPFALPTGDSLHYMAVNGNDACNGLSPAIGSSGTCAWRTPNHNLNCGDVIVAAPSSTTYGALTAHGAVSNCPSTTGGIDGTGGIWAAIVLCGGADLGETGNGCRTSRVNNNQNFWAYIGWTCNGGAVSGSGGTRCYQLDATASGTTQVHHQMYINDIAYNTPQAFDTDDQALNHNVPGNGGDYVAIVGMIAQDAGSDSVCTAAISLVGMSPFDALSGTHAYVYGSWVYNVESAGCTNSDVEAIMIDTPDAHSYNNQIVIANNMQWAATRYGYQFFCQSFNLTTVTAIYHNNTSFDNLINIGSQGDSGDVNLAFANHNGAPDCNQSTLVIQNNIALTNRATSGSISGKVYAGVFGGTQWMNITNGGTGNENWFKGIATTCGSTCNGGAGTPPFSVEAFNSNTIGTNIYTDPAFTNTTDLLANWVTAVPNCAGFVTTTACMGYNVATQVLTPNTPISDLTPTAVGSTSKGYQLPSSTCNTNSEYPAFLKGLVRLAWNAGMSQVFQMHDLVTTPCGM